MKLTSVVVLCLYLIFVHTNLSLARKIGGGGGFGKSFGFKKTPTSSRGSTHTNTGRKTNQGTKSQGAYPKQPGQPNQAGYPQQPGRPGYPGGYPQQPGGGGYHNQYPGYQPRGYPYGGGVAAGGGHGYGGYGGYPGGYINHNPNNRILSPHYGGSYGYGGYGYGGGSPFSQSVQAMGMGPSDKSRGFGRSAVMAAAGGAVAGMALGYGLGRFPRPHFQFHSPTEEYYYNNYMYKKYGTKSTDTNDYSRDYAFSPTTLSYERYMDSCMKRKDLLPVENRQQNIKPATTSTTTTTTVVTSVSDADSRYNTSERNSTEAERSLSPIAPETNPVAPASQDIGITDDVDDTVSIVEIGYPALIEQVKAKRCVELYMVHAERQLKLREPRGGVQGLGMGFQELLLVVTGTLLMLLNSNVVMFLH